MTRRCRLSGSPRGNPCPSRPGARLKRSSGLRWTTAAQGELEPSLAGTQQVHVEAGEAPVLGFLELPSHCRHLKDITSNSSFAPRTCLSPTRFIICCFCASKAVWRRVSKVRQCCSARLRATPDNQRAVETPREPVQREKRESGVEDRKQHTSAVISLTIT